MSGLSTIIPGPDWMMLAQKEAGEEAQKAFAGLIERKTVDYASLDDAMKHYTKCAQMVFIKKGKLA